MRTSNQTSQVYFLSSSVTMNHFCYLLLQFLLLEVSLNVGFLCCILLCYCIYCCVFPSDVLLFCSLAGPFLASDTISSLSLPSDYRSVSLGGVDDVSPETQDQSDGTASAGAFGNMMFIDYPMIGLNKSKETCTHPVYFTWTSVSHWSSCTCWVLPEVCGFVWFISLLICIYWHMHVIINLVLCNSDEVSCFSRT